MSRSPEKVAYVKDKSLISFDFEQISPDANANWLNQSNSNFDTLLPLANRKTKLAKRVEDECAVFGLYSMGVITARDEWVHDFHIRDLEAKVVQFIAEYESRRAVYGGQVVDDSVLGSSIKWTRDLKRQLRLDVSNAYDGSRIQQSLYRPYVNKSLYYSQNLNEMLYQLPQVFPDQVNTENKAICFLGSGARRPFAALATDRLPSYALFIDSTQCLPLYRYTAEGDRVCNITGWGIRQFNDHYRREWGDAFAELAGPEGITAEDIFAYTYAVLHNPSYREEYRVDLLREFPRLPFYPDFPVWRDMGQALLDLHIGFEDAEPFPLERVDLEGDPRRVILRADREKGAILLDDKTTLTGVPPEAWEYQLGSRSALEWVLDQYKERKPRDPTIAEKFNTYRFADYKERVIDLLQRVCTVSVRTVEIVERMASLDHEKARP